MGICAHSLGGKYVVFCVGQDAQRIDAFKTWATAARLSIKQLSGCYKGQREISFIASEDTFQRLKHWVQEEESVLVLNRPNRLGHRPATLVYGAREQSVGYLRAASRSEALLRDSWTYDPLSQSYFIAE